MVDDSDHPDRDRGWRPIPDPTVLTTEQLERAVKGTRDYIDGQVGIIEERLSGMDRATELLSSTVNRVPTDVDKQINHLRGLIDERFHSIETQFKERDTRSERESRDNKVAVDAAFAAQKEAASEQNKSNTLAIDKSERATTETINKLAELFKTSTDGLVDKIDDIKLRIGAVEATMTGVISRGTGSTDAKTDSRAWIAIGVSVLFLIVAVAAAVAAYAAKP
jgi:cation transport regulator ChaB